MSDSIIFFTIAFIGGLVAVPVGGSFLFVMPSFFLLGLNGIQTLLLSRIFALSAVATGSSYFLKNHREEFSWNAIIKFLSGNIIGFIIAARIATLIDVDLLTKIVPFVLLGGALLLIKDWKLKNLRHQKFFQKILPLLGFLMGLYAGLGGAPSAFVILILTLALGFGIHRAVVNTRLIEVVGNSVAAGSYLFFGAQFTGFEIPVILGGILGGLLGAKLTFKTKPTWLKKAFLILVVLAAIKTTFF
ncbi:MAG: sulfite exporter TauE/SafE family protein [Candidatus Peribacteraceae bacterium]|nr:sulfite exporter TauE/SafE family protein [Candidatus Peribacteraceae bacterium]